MRYFLFLFTCLILTCLPAQDSLMTTMEWAEEGETYILRLAPHGAFEEDAGENFTRSSQYLMGRWSYADSTATLTLAVDYFMGQNMVASRYRKGQDFYLVYEVTELSDSTMILRDAQTGKHRRFAARERTDGPDASERRKPKPTLKPDFGPLKLPKGWGG